MQKKKIAGKFNYDAKKIYLDNIIFCSLAIRSFDIGSRFAMKLVVRFREVKIQSKRHILRGWDGHKHTVGINRLTQ